MTGAAELEIADRDRRPASYVQAGSRTSSRAGRREVHNRRTVRRELLTVSCELQTIIDERMNG